MEPWVFAVDLGATNVRVGLVDQGGTVVLSARRPTPQEGPGAVVEAIADLTREVAAKAGRRADRVGVGVPGPLDVAEGIVDEPPNLRGWRRVPLRAMLEARLGLPVVLENDANAAALGEWWKGAGQGSRHLLYITWSTGIGGGLVWEGRLYRGASGTAGEIGHIVVDPDGPLCPCGRRGHLEGIAAGPAIVRAAREAMARGEPSALRHLAAFTAEEVAAAARAGDPLSRRVFEHAARMVGLVVGGMLNLLNPEVVVIGGGVARAGEVAFEPLREAARSVAFDGPFRSARIVPAALGDDAGLVGAAYLAIHA